MKKTKANKEERVKQQSTKVFVNTISLPHFQSSHPQTYTWLDVRLVPQAW